MIISQFSFLSPANSDGALQEDIVEWTEKQCKQLSVLVIARPKFTLATLHTAPGES